MKLLFHLPVIDHSVDKFPKKSQNFPGENDTIPVSFWHSKCAGSCLCRASSDRFRCSGNRTRSAQLPFLSPAKPLSLFLPSAVSTAFWNRFSDAAFRPVQESKRKQQKKQAPQKRRRKSRRQFLVSEGSVEG